MYIFQSITLSLQRIFRPQVRFKVCFGQKSNYLPFLPTSRSKTLRALARSHLRGFVDESAGQKAPPNERQHWLGINHAIDD